MIARDLSTVSLRVWLAALWLLAISAGWLGPDMFSDVSNDLSADRQTASASDAGDGSSPDLLPASSTSEPGFALVPELPVYVLVACFLLALLPVARNLIPPFRPAQNYAHSRAPPLRSAASACV